MASSWAFKTTASLIKPTREALLDYCAYILLVVALIGTARIIIGRSELQQLCSRKTVIQGNTSQPLTNKLNKTGDDVLTKPNLDEETQFILQSNLKVHPVKDLKVADDKDEISADKHKQDSNSSVLYFCLKHYQAYLPYFLLTESVVLLLIGILWVKMPSVQLLIKEFASILHECRQSTWYVSVADVMQSESSIPVTQSLFTLMKSDAVNMEMILLLETLFRPNSAYLNKSQARRLYERVQKFCIENENSVALLNSYISKSIAQFIAWMLFFFINMVLFVKFEFYSTCGWSEVCEHDTFLRIIWYMAQLLVLVYGIFNCSALKWINDKAVYINRPRRYGMKRCPIFPHPTTMIVIIGCNKNLTFMFCCRHFLCCVDVNDDLSKKRKFVKCRPFKVGEGQTVVHNDIALLLHLASSSNHKTITYFTIFLFDQWKEKFSQPVEDVHIESPIKQKLVKQFPARKSNSSSHPLLTESPSYGKVSFFIESPHDEATDSPSSSSKTSGDLSDRISST
ncbi:uncharacterized protein LOC100185148 [Ciona intestinalis]